VANFGVASEETMIALGVAYGKGLQLINILRDVGADLRGAGAISQRMSCAR
jgi:phytoene/squalene synthetase